MGDILVFGLSNGKIAIVGTDLSGNSARSSNSGPLISQADSLSLPYRISVTNKSLQSRSRGSGPVSKQSVFSFGNQSNKKILPDMPTQHVEVNVKFDHGVNSSEIKDPDLAMEATEIKYHQLHKDKVRSVLYWAEESRIISTGADGTIVIADETGTILKSPPPFKTPIMSIILVKRNEKFFKNSAVKKSAKEGTPIHRLQGFQKILNDESSKQSELVFIDENKSGKQSKRAQRKTKTDIVEFMALWDLLDGQRKDACENQAQSAEDGKVHNGAQKDAHAEVEELRLINKKLLKICSTLEHKND
jgi:hypothetical protein